MSEILQFIVSVLHHWQVLLTGGIVIAVVTIYERYKKKALRWQTYFRLIVGFLIVAMFLAWRDEHQISQKLKTTQASSEAILREKEKRIEDLKVKIEDIVRSKPIQVQAAPEPPVVEGLRYVQKRVASHTADAKFAIEVTIQTNTVIQPTLLLIERDGEIHSGDCYVVGRGAYTEMGLGIDPGKPNTFYIRFSSPPFTPQTPLVATLVSKSAIQVKGIKRVRIP